MLVKIKMSLTRDTPYFITPSLQMPTPPVGIFFFADTKAVTVPDGMNIILHTGSFPHFTFYPFANLIISIKMNTSKLCKGAFLGK